MKRIILALGLGAALLTGTVQATPLPTLRVNGSPLSAVHSVEHGTTYVGLRALSAALDPEAVIRWKDGTATVQTDELSLSVSPHLPYLTANGRFLYIPGGVRVDRGQIHLPVRVLADAFGASVTWNGTTREVSVKSGPSVPQASYDPDALYWLSRIISAESRGEPLIGQIAVGNVVLNRVKSPHFPSSIYEVIFDPRWGGQFEPVRNGTVYHDPAESSVMAAKMALEGADIVGECLYFLEPTLAGNLWTVENRTFYATIGHHDFYL